MKNKFKWVLFSLFLILAVSLSFVLYNKIQSKNNNKELSIVLPVYNVAEYLPKCLESLISQTYNHLEIICVNDGSTDNSLDILNEYKKKDKRFIIIDKENGGVSSARNAGMRASHGKYITFVDPDDYVSKDAYEKCMDKLKESDADLLVFDYIIEPENRQPIKLTNKIYQDPFEAVSDPDINSGFVWNKIFKHSTLVENNICFKEDISYAEDNLFLNMALTKSRCTVTCPGALYHYQYHENSSGNAASNEKRIENAIKRCNYIIDYYIEEGYTTRYEWVLDYCLAITEGYIKNIQDKQKQQYYSSKLLEILDNKLIPLMKNIPENLLPILNEIRKLAV